MDEHQLTAVLNGGLGNVFKGVFSSNEFETLSVESPAGYIFNTKPNDHPREHWVAVYIDNSGFTNYLDSYGFPPQQASFVDFLNKRSCEWKHSNMMIQSFFTQACGQYCICFLLYMNEFNNFNHFLCLFSQTNLLSNDKRIHKLI